MAATEATTPLATPWTDEQPRFPTVPSRIVNIGIRKSLLSRIQSKDVLGVLQKHWPDKEFVIQAIGSIASTDEEDLTPLHDFDDKSLWTHELEALLQEGEVDMVINKVKDIPLITSSHHNILPIAAILPRADPRSALILTSDASSSTSLSQLAPNSAVGTTSVLRLAQLRHLYPHLSFQILHGKPDALLNRLDDGSAGLSALVLGGAPLERSGHGKRITRYLQSSDEGASDNTAGEVLLHAVGQGALGVTVRADDRDTAKLVQPLSSMPAVLSCIAERTFAKALLDGGCGGLVAVSTSQTSGGALTLHGLATSHDGTQTVKASVTKDVASPADAEAIGQLLARELLDQGADKLLEKVSMDSGAVEAQSEQVF